MGDMRVNSEPSLSFTSSSASSASLCSTTAEDGAIFEGTLEPPHGVEDPEAHESCSGIFLPCSHLHGDAFSHESTATASLSRRDWYEQRMALSFTNITTSEVVWLITYVSNAIAYMRSDAWLWGQGVSRAQACHYCARAESAKSKTNSSPTSMLRALYTLVRSSKDLRLMSDAARFVSCSISNKSRPWVDACIHESISPLYAHLSCRMLELAALLDEASAASPAHDLTREQNKDARCINNDLDLADSYPTPYYYYLNAREQDVRIPSHKRSSSITSGVDSSYEYTHHPDN
jgi:hypothetical protein